MAPSVMLALTLAHLLISFACGQLNNTSPKSCLVTQTHQLTVDGCPVFVHDVTGAKDFVIEPLMCITENISNVFPQIDPLTQQMFLSVPVTLRDDSIFAEISNQLQHLSPKTINFATVSDISVSMDASSKCVQALMFLWSPDEPVGYLRLGSTKHSANCRVFFLKSKDSVFDAINGVIATAKIEMGSTQTELKYKLMLQNQNLFYPEFYGSKFECRSYCDNLQFYQTIIYGKCIARVHQRQDVNEIFYVEPLLCPTNSVSSDSMMYDYSRDMYYLKLDVVMQNDTTLNAVQNQLAHLSPTNVSYLQLWRVEIAVSSLLRSRFEIGPLMVSEDWRSGQVRVYCKTEEDWKLLRSNITANPLSFWSHVKFELKSHTPSQCVVKSNGFFYNVPLIKASNIGQIKNGSQEMLTKLILGVNCQTKNIGNRIFVIIQQRMSDSVSFARTWNEYEAGFGDTINFWIGLSTIHSLTINGATLRVEMKLWNGGTELHAEYAGFKVGNAGNNYTMTFREMIRDRSNVTYDAFGGQQLSGTQSSEDRRIDLRGMQFSTKDRDNDPFNNFHCSLSYGGGGWWFKDCDCFNANGVYGGVSGEKDMVWCTSSEPRSYLALREIRMMLQI